MNVQLALEPGHRANYSLVREYYCQKRISAVLELQKFPTSIGSIVEKAGDRGVGGYPARFPWRDPV
jgi:hypothetical protein